MVESTKPNTYVSSARGELVLTQEQEKQAMFRTANPSSLVDPGTSLTKASIDPDKILSNLSH